MQGILIKKGRRLSLQTRFNHEHKVRWRINWIVSWNDGGVNGGGKFDNRTVDEEIVAKESTWKKSKISEQVDI